MRQACKNIMYTIVNSRAYELENLQAGMEAWKKIAIAVDMIVLVGLSVLSITAVRKYNKRK